MAEEQEKVVKKAFIYCRTSEDSEEKEQTGNRYSIDEQLESSIHKAKSEGYEIIESFEERNRKSWTYPTGWNYSADIDVINRLTETRLPKREVTRDLLSHMILRLNEVDAIIVRNIDRLVRSLGYSDLHLQLMRSFRENNIKIISCDQAAIDTNDAGSTNLFFGVTAAVTGQDLISKAKRTKSALGQARRMGKSYFCPTFYGFVRDKYNMVVRNEAECKVIQDIFSRFNNNEPISAIARNLNSSGIKPPMRHCKLKDKKNKIRHQGNWEHSMIKAILGRPQYAGFQFKAKDDEVEWWKKRTRVKTVLYQPPVIETEVYEESRKLLEKNKNNVNQSGCKNPHALSGLLVCTHCEKNLYITSTYKKIKRLDNKKVAISSYRCITNKKTSKNPKCKDIFIREKRPEELIDTSPKLFATGIEDCLLPLLYKGYIIRLNRAQQRPELQNEIDDYTKRLSIAEHELVELITSVIDGKYTPEIADVLRPKLEARCMELKQKITKLTSEAENIDRETLPSIKFTDYPSKDIPAIIKRQLFAEVIKKVIVAQKYIKVELKAGGSFKLKRILTKSGSWDLPKWTITTYDDKSFEEQDDGIVYIRKTELTPDTKFSIVYEYKNNDPYKIMVENDNLMIWSVGAAKNPHNKLKRILKK